MIIAPLRCDFDNTKSRWSTSPDTSVHLHTPQIPSEHFTYTCTPIAASTSVADLSAGTRTSRPDLASLSVKSWFT